MHTSLVLVCQIDISLGYHVGVSLVFVFIWYMVLRYKYKTRCTVEHSSCSPAS